MARAIVVCVVAAACFAPAFPTTFDELRSEIRLAAHLRPLSEEDRELTVLGWPARIARQIPPEEAVDFVMLEPGARDLVVFTGALVAPRPCRFFESREAWQQRKRAEFLRDSLAANHPPGPPPPPARVVVFADSRRDPPMWVERR